MGRVWCDKWFCFVLLIGCGLVCLAGVVWIVEWVGYGLLSGLGLVY